MQLLCTFLYLLSHISLFTFLHANTYKSYNNINYANIFLFNFTNFNYSQRASKQYVSQPKCPCHFTYCFLPKENPETIKMIHRSIKKQTKNKRTGAQEGMGLLGRNPFSKTKLLFCFAKQAININHLLFRISKMNYTRAVLHYKRHKSLTIQIKSYSQVRAFSPQFPELMHSADVISMAQSVGHPTSIFSCT